MGVWALLVSLGPPLAPLIMGFVGQYFRSLYELQG